MPYISPDDMSRTVNTDNLDTTLISFFLFVVIGYLCYLWGNWKR